MDWGSVFHEELQESTIPTLTSNSSLKALLTFSFLKLISATRQDGFFPPLKHIAKPASLIVDRKHEKLVCIIFMAFTKKELSVPSIVFQLVQYNFLGE